MRPQQTDKTVTVVQDPGEQPSILSCPFPRLDGHFVAESLSDICPSYTVDPMMKGITEKKKPCFLYVSGTIMATKTLQSWV